MLAAPGIGIDDDFFRSGGDSISALHLTSRMQRETGFPVSVQDVFEYPTIRTIVDNVLSRPADSADVPREVVSGGEVPLLPIQRWFFAKPLADRSRYHQNFAIRTPALDVPVLQAALDRLVEHHDAFRLRYRDNDGDIEQFYDADSSPVALRTLRVAGLRDHEVQDRLAAWQTGFDLERGPTFRVAYLDGFADGSARVWFAVHHLAIDVVSWRILAQDLEILYHGGVLGSSGSSYRQWTRAVRRYVPAEGEEQQWARVAAEVTAEGFLGVPGAARHRAEFTLGGTETEALFTTGTWAYDTDVNDLLLTAVGYALRAVTGRTRHYVTVEGHGRESFDGAPDVRTTMGWFTTMHPLPIETHTELDQSILATRAHRRRVPYHGIGYGLLRGGYGSTTAPLPSISVNYLGRFTSGRPGGPAWRLDAETWVGAAVVGGEEANESALDVTMSCVDGHLVTVVDSRWDEAVTERFVAELAQGLADLARHTSAVARDGWAGNGRPKRDVDSAFAPFIPIDAGASGRTLFVLPPGEGGAESYLNNIAKKLAGHRLVLFNNVHLHAPRESFEEVAEFYLEHIRRIQPSGPYSLLGWSFGGVLSVELARALAVAGERIDHLLLIDPYFNVPHALKQAGLSGPEHLLDPINYRYTPSRADLDRLSAVLGELVLFKACEPNEITTSEDQRRLFESYRRSEFNHLDSLLPDTPIRLVPLVGGTHHDWVRDERCVTAMTRIIRELLTDPESRHPTIAEDS